MWKPTLLYWIMGGGLLAGSLAGKNGMRAVMGQQINLPDGVWKKLNLAWSTFFLAMGGINLLVAYHFSEEIWVNFKLFGGIGLMVAFVIAQSLYLSKYIEDSK